MHEKTGYTKMYVDNSTGELVTSTDLPKLTHKQFAMFFIKNLAILHTAKKINYDVFFELVNMMDYENTVDTNLYYKKKIAEATGLTVGAIDTAIARIVDAGLAKRIGRGVYFIDPKIVGKGYWKNIYKLRLTFEALSKDEKVKRIHLQKEVEYDYDYESDNDIIRGNDEGKEA